MNLPRIEVCLVILGFSVAAWAGTTYWSPVAGGNLDDAGNWGSTPAADSTCYVQKKLTGPLTLSTTEVSFFGGAMLRYNTAISVTNDFGEGFAITNLGSSAASALHVENGATLVHKSGKIIAYKGTAYNGVYISGNSTFVVDGPHAEFDCRNNINLRSNDGMNFVCPRLFVTNGAFVGARDFSVGSGGDGAPYFSSLVHVAGEGTVLTAASIFVANDIDRRNQVLTNRLVATDGALLRAPKFYVGWKRSEAQAEVSHGAVLDVNTETIVGQCDYAVVSNALLRVADGGIFTNATLKLGNHSSTKHSGPNNRVVVSGSGSQMYSTGDTTVYSGNVFRVEQGGFYSTPKMFVFGQDNVWSGGRLEIADGGAAELSHENGFTVTRGGAVDISGGALTNRQAVKIGPQGTVLVENGGFWSVAKGFTIADQFTMMSDAVVTNMEGATIESTGCVDLSSGAHWSVGKTLTVSGVLVGEGGSLSVGNILDTYSSSQIALTNAAVSLTGDFNVRGRASFKGCTVDYSRIMMSRDNAEISFEDCEVSGARLQMTQSNTVVRLINTQYTMASTPAASLFMMGDSSGSANYENSSERHVYLGGTNTWLKNMNTSFGGFFARGTNTTVHVSIPAEGFSTEHAVIDVNGVSVESGRLKIAIDVDPQLPVRGGGTYTLIESRNAIPDRIDFFYDHSLVSVVRTTDNKKIKIQVRDLRGTLILFR